MKRTDANSCDRFTTETATFGHVDDCETQHGGTARDKTLAHVPSPDDDFDLPIARAGTLSRTKTLFLAAVRLWELKRGLRNN